MSELSLVPWMSGEEPYLILELEMRVDGEVLPEPCNRASLRALVASAQEPRRHFIFTCSCGVPECGGFVNGIDVAGEGERITWTDGDWTYSYEFDAEQYCAEVERALELSRELLANVTSERVHLLDDWDGSLFPEWHESTERLMHGWENEYRRRRGVPGLPGERQVGWPLFFLGWLLWPWHFMRGMLWAMRSEPRETAVALPAIFWHVFKSQRKAEWDWVRARLRRLPRR